MDSAAPTILALETDSAWLVILAVSAVTVTAALLLRRLIGRVGGTAAGLLLSLPLVLPVIAAALYTTAVLPEISVLRPTGAALLGKGEQLLHLLRVGDGSSETFVPYAMTGSAGPWLILIGAAITLFMLVRRVIGMLLVRRLIRDSRPPLPSETFIQESLERVVRAAGRSEPPPLLVLPPGYSGAFAVGARAGKILISTDLVSRLEADELDAVLAHELAHIRSRDLLVVSLAGFLRDAVAWNPFAHVAYARLVSDREYEADRKAAALTGKPLAVASGLLKMLEVPRSRRGIRHRTALAFLHRGAGISKRVNGLIAVADGRANVSDAGSAPFLVAGCLVVVLGLQVGAQMAEDHAGLAIVWGEARVADGELWKAPKRMRKTSTDLMEQRVLAIGDTRQTFDLSRPLRYPELSAGIRVKEADVDRWLRVVDRRVKVAGLRSATLTWEKRWDWRATPIFEAPAAGVPIGIYRLDQDL
ncbi:MAG: M56 family metallopeptidase [Actinomycetota bacterium]